MLVLKLTLVNERGPGVHHLLHTQNYHGIDRITTAMFKIEWHKTNDCTIDEVNGFTGKTLYKQPIAS